MFELLLKVMTEHDLLDKPDRIYNVDETGVQLNNSTGKVIATRGARVVHSITSGEKAKVDVQKKVLQTAVKFPKKIPAKCIKKRRGIRESSDEMTISDISNESDSDIDQARAGEIDLHKKKQRSQAKIQSKIPAKTNKKRRIEYKDSSDEMSISNNSDESESEAYKDSECKECFEEYKKTKSTADWIQCVKNGYMRIVPCTATIAINVVGLNE
ncbi:hypothetical protein PYW08_016970 [Mythimna loreyi]|nr:hypothetical protein PYW08_016970 [Mythimna loreyi]